MPADTLDTAASVIDSVVTANDDELVELRRDLHAHPELSWAETRTTDLVAARGREGGLAGHPAPADRAARRARATTARWSPCAPTSTRCRCRTPPTDPWTSTVPGVAHACGHDVHTAALVGAGLALAEVARPRAAARAGPAAVPARRGGHARRGPAPDRRGRARGRRARLRRCTATPASTSGQVGLRLGPLTGAADRARGPARRARGGHTSRPHLTEDLTFALAKVDHRAAGDRCRRRLDPRAGVSLVWGDRARRRRRQRDPATGGLAAGTVRMLDAVAWADAEDAGPRAGPRHRRAVRRERRGRLPAGRPAGRQRAGRPPGCWPAPSSACSASTAACSTTQSLGGEDFGWYLDQVPGAMAPPRHAHARRPDVRPPPGQPARRRAGHGHRRAGPGRRRRRFFGHRPITT